MKLEAIGLHAKAVGWFKSYLADRHLVAGLSGTLSSEASVKCGVPQGSILGQLLFLIYVNDMAAVVNNILLYTDDTGILVADKCISNIE